LTIVFDYDAVYDDLKAVERQKKAKAEKDRIERKVRLQMGELTDSLNIWIIYLLPQKCGKETT
jgi:Coiled-coil domain-containing protein 55 (DUF2040)